MNDLTSPHTQTESIDCGERFILGFRGLTIPPWLREFADRHRLGGVILFDYNVQTKTYENNVESPAQLQKLCAELHGLNSSPLIFIDQEGGKVRRLKESLGFAPLPSAKAMGESIASPATLPSLLETLKKSFSEMKSLGIDVNLGPVIDLDLNPENPDLGKVHRCFSASEQVVTKAAKLWFAAAQASGLSLCLKHYPGMGAATKNSHEELTDIRGKVPPNQIELFYSLTKEMMDFTSQALVLVSHGITDESEGLPATASIKGIEIMRRHLAHTALILSDDLQMQGLQRIFPGPSAPLKCLEAGLDMVLIGNNMLPEDQNCLEYAHQFAQQLKIGPENMRAQHLQCIRRIQLLKQSTSRG